MQLPDGTSAEVVELTNAAGAVSAVVLVTWPDGSAAKGFVTFNASLSVTSGPMEHHIAGLGGDGLTPPVGKL
jgi:hypothetical protein